MAATAITVQQVTEAGTTVTAPVAADTANGNVVNNQNGATTFLYVVNGTGAQTLTVVTPNTVSGLAIADRVYALAANTTYVLGPFPISVYGTSLQFTASAATVTVNAFQI